MQEVKISTNVNEAGTKGNMSIKLDVESMGLNWNKGDTIRVKTYKKEGRIVLKAVGKKISKTVCHKLTTTGGSATTHALGFKLNYRKSRFKGPLAQIKTIDAATRFTNKKNNEIEIFLPREVFA